MSISDRILKFWAKTRNNLQPILSRDTVMRVWTNGSTPKEKGVLKM